MFSNISTSLTTDQTLTCTLRIDKKHHKLKTVTTQDSIQF